MDRSNARSRARCGCADANTTRREVCFRVHPRHVYVHVPFCARRCVYCDFSIAVRRVVPHAEYVDALRREVELRYAGKDLWEVDTLYFGGGTPSRLGAEGVVAMVAMLRNRLTL